MTNLFARHIATFSNYKTFLSKTLKVCAWICWGVGAFYVAVPYFYAFSGTRIGAMTIVSFSFFAGIVGGIGFGFYLLSKYAKKENHSPLEKAVLWCIGGAAVYGVFLFAIWAMVEYFTRKA